MIKTQWFAAACALAFVATAAQAQAPANAGKAAAPAASPRTASAPAPAAANSPGIAPTAARGDQATTSKRGAKRKTATKVAAAATGDAGASTKTPHYGSWGFDMAGRDTTVKPGDDFFRYANGTYLKTTEIPSDRTRFGNFDALSILSENRVHEILDEASASPGAAATPRGKIGAFYKAYMDEGRVNALGAKPLAPDLARIKAATTHEQLATLMGRHDGFFDSIFGAYVGADAKHPTVNTVNMSTGGLGLPDRDYYLTPNFAKQKAAYQVYVGKMLTLIGWPAAETRAADIVAFETKLAEASWTRIQRRDRDKTYNESTVADLQAMAPGFDFKRFLVAADLGSADRIVLGDNTAFAAKAKIFSDTPVDVLQAWMAFNLAENSAPFLSKPFVDARFEFRNKTLNGQPEQGARWKRAVAATNGVLGEATGEIYVQKYFTPEAKAQMLDLVNNIRTALKGRIERLDWMSAPTKAQALDKLNKFTVKIAYPETWRDYSKLQIVPGDLYGDAKRARRFEWNYRTSKLRLPVDKKEWGMTPQTVNAYYNSVNNEIVFPAAILQPPFFDPKADPAINYGGIGGVIGHEISHGFDDQGRKSNGDGVLKDWWTAEDATKFKAKTDALGKQYSAVELLPGEHIQGALTMGENIGDAGGINLALDAYHASLHGKPAPVIDGLTGDQRVFLGWAQVWRQKQRDAALLQQLHTDPHSPAEARVDQPVRNVDAWYAAFDVKPGDKLYLSPEQRVKIW